MGRDCVLGGLGWRPTSCRIRSEKEEEENYFLFIIPKYITSLFAINIKV